MRAVCITHMIHNYLPFLLWSQWIPATFVHLPPNKVSTSSPTAKEGSVKGVITYTIMDDLTVTPISTISIIAMLHNFNLEQVEDLEEEVVNVGMNDVNIIIPFVYKLF